MFSHGHAKGSGIVNPTGIFQLLAQFGNDTFAVVAGQLGHEQSKYGEFGERAHGN